MILVTVWPSNFFFLPPWNKFSVSELAKFYLTFSDLVAMVVVSKYFENLQDIVNSHFRVFFVD